MRAIRSARASVEPIVCALLALVALAFGSRFKASSFDNYSLLADAMVHGRLWIDWPGPYIDAVLWNGHRYVVNDPMPALLLVPFAAIWHANVNQTILGTILAAGAAFAAAVLARRLGCGRAARAWLVAFVFFGTDLFWCASLGDVWFVAQVSATFFAMFALVECFGRGRAWLVAVLWACACFSRFTLVVATPAVVALACVRLDGTTRAGARASVARFAATLVPFVVAYVAYNLARWGVPWDSGHTVFYHQDAQGSPTGSPFSPRNVPYELYSFVMQAPTFLGAPPWLRPEPTAGVALVWTSPALVLAFSAHRPRRIVAILWLGAALAAGPSLFYYANGYAQFGMRHALDFEPFLFVLMAIAARDGLPRWAAVLCAISILAGIWGVWYWRSFVQTF